MAFCSRSPIFVYIKLIFIELLVSVEKDLGEVCEGWSGCEERKKEAGSSCQDWPQRQEGHHRVGGSAFSVKERWHFQVFRSLALKSAHRSSKGARMTQFVGYAAKPENPFGKESWSTRLSAVKLFNGIDAYTYPIICTATINSYALRNNNLSSKVLVLQFSYRLQLASR